MQTSLGGREGTREATIQVREDEVAFEVGSSGCGPLPIGWALLEMLRVRSDHSLHGARQPVEIITHITLPRTRGAGGRESPCRQKQHVAEIRGQA